jgi:hypothetical protein
MQILNTPILLQNRPTRFSGRLVDPSKPGSRFVEAGLAAKTYLKEAQHLLAHQRDFDFAYGDVRREKGQVVRGGFTATTRNPEAETQKISYSLGKYTQTLTITNKAGKSNCQTQFWGFPIPFIFGKAERADFNQALAAAKQTLTEVTARFLG